MFKKLLEKDFVFLDGGMGTMIQSTGVDAGHIPELLNITNPDIIKDIHRSYIESGSDIVYANTFGANSYKLKDSGLSLIHISEPTRPY